MNKNKFCVNIILLLYKTCMAFLVEPVPEGSFVKVRGFYEYWINILQYKSEFCRTKINNSI